MNIDPADRSFPVITQAASSALQLEMAVRLQQTLEVTDALWALVPVVVAAGEREDCRNPADVADASPSGRRLDAASRARARDVADRHLALVDLAFESLVPDVSALPMPDAATLIADPFGAFSSVVDIPAFVAPIPPMLEEVNRLSPSEVSYFHTYAQAVSKWPRTPWLLRALFITAADTVEPLVNRLVRLLLHHDQPQSYEGLADPKLDDQARKLCFGSPAVWRTTLVEKLGVSSLSDAVEWAGLERLWEDRNVIAHRAGIADARHNLRTGSEPGTVLGSTPEEVQTAIDMVGAARFALAAGTWDHITPGMGAMIAGESWAPLWESLRAGRWRQAEGLGRVEEAFAADQESIANAKVNRWLAVEQGCGLEAIRDNVLAWDVSGLPREYEVARHLLLHHDDEGIALLGDLVADGTVSGADLDEWPLFDRLQESGRLDALRYAADLRRVAGAGGWPSQS